MTTVKFELNRPTDYSEEAILREIQRVAHIVDKPLTRTKFDKNSKYSASTIEKRFGTWHSALIKAGLDETFLHKDNVKISTEEIIAELKRVSENLKTDSFTREQFASNSKMTKYIFHGKNSFNKIMKLAGLSVPTNSKRYTDNECFENLLNVWTHYGRQPNYSEIKKAPSIVGAKAYVVRWGSWKKALLAFLDKVNSDVTLNVTSPSSDNENTIEEKAQKKKILPEDRREVSVGLRFTIFKRDNYKCVMCGRSPATTFGLELHADHIIPFSKNGKTIETNLRTLCNECNIGKSNQLD